MSTRFDTSRRRIGAVAARDGQIVLQRRMRDWRSREWAISCRPMEPTPSTTSPSGSPTATRSRTSLCDAPRHARDRAHRRLHAGRRGCAPRQADAVRGRGPARPRRAGAGRAARVATSTRALAALPAELRGRRAARRRRHLRGARGPRPRARSRRRQPTSSTTSTTSCCACPTRRAARERPRGARACARTATTGCRSATSAMRARSRARRAETERPLLNHIALLVDSGQEQLDEARAPRASRSPRSATRRTRSRLRVGPGRHQARVRRAQAELLARLAP